MGDSEQVDRHHERAVILEDDRPRRCPGVEGEQRQEDQQGMNPLPTPRRRVEPQDPAGGILLADHGSADGFTTSRLPTRDLARCARERSGCFSSTRPDGSGPRSRSRGPLSKGAGSSNGAPRNRARRARKDECRRQNLVEIAWRELGCPERAKRRRGPIRGPKHPRSTQEIAGSRGKPRRSLPGCERAGRLKRCAAGNRRRSVTGFVAGECNARKNAPRASERRTRRARATRATSRTAETADYTGIDRSAGKPD